MDKKNSVQRWLLIILTLLGCAYLIAIPFGLIKDAEQKLGTTEVIIFVVLLLLNAGFLERLVKIGISEKGLDLELKVEEVRQEQVRQQAEIDTLRFILSHLITRHELSHLSKLAYGEPFPYTKTKLFTTELRQLRALGFIENHPGKYISSMPHKGDVKDFFKITPRGEQYLQLKEQLGSEDEVSEV